MWSADLSPSPVLLVHSDGRVIHANQSFVKLVGREVTGCFLAELVAEPPEQVAQALRSWARTATPLPGALSIAANDEDPQRITCRGARVPSVDPPTIAIYFLLGPQTSLVEPFERVNRLSKELLYTRALSTLDSKDAEAQRLSAVDKVREAFVATLSHDLKTPVTVIIAMAELLANERDVSPEQRDLLIQKISENARRMQEMLAAMLSRERFAVAQSGLDAKPTKLNELIQRVVDSVADEDHPVVTHVEQRIATVDEVVVQRIIENLVGNACRYTPSGTRILVTVEPTREGLLLGVEDDGPGIPDELKDDIFLPFTRGEATASETTGTGLGLSLVAQLAALHGGRAWVEDRDGGGASFRVTLSEV